MKTDLTEAQLAQEFSVKLPLRALLQLGAPMRLAALKSDGPAIGRLGLYGINAGIARADDHGPDHIIEVLDEAPDKLTWQQAMDWAASIDGTLPTRKEQALLFANVPELFQPEAYSSCEQYAGDERSAWVQYFLNGYQSYHRKGLTLRARAVRRLNLE